MKVLNDKGHLVVAVLDGKRRVRMGTRQAAGKEKACCVHSNICTLRVGNFESIILLVNINF